MATKQASVLDALVNELQARMQGAKAGYGFKHGSPSGTPTTNYMHGPGGIFGVSGLERDIISTRVQPMGLLSALPTRGTLRTNPLYPYITGFLADTGAEKNGVCADPPTAGLTKSCLQTAQFGRYERMTKELELNRIGQQTDRGEFLDLTLLNDPLLESMGGLMDIGVNGNPALTRETLMAFVEVGVSMQNILSRQLYEGNPSNNSALGGYKEFPGLDILIGTDKVDAITGVQCPSLDSDIKNFNYGLVTGGTSDIVEVLTYLMRYLKWNAQTMNLDPATFGIAMRPDLFYELTSIWPCSYLTYRCTFRTGGAEERINVDARDAVDFRDSMRNGNYLLVDGMQIPVFLDSAITEQTNTTNANVPSGQFSSDIYVVPLMVKGSYAATFMEYLDYSQGAMIGASDGRYSDGTFWTDGGRWLWHRKPPLNWCIQWLLKIEPRVILRTPQLAGRIQNVRYAPLQHTRDPFPGDPYFVDGGLTSRAGPSYYSDWNLT